MGVLLVLFLLCSPICKAQHIHRITNLNVSNGLSQSSVYNMTEDSFGFLWLTTGDGINRYDGRDFIVYKSRLNDTVHGYLKDRNINSPLYEDKWHNLWFAADEGVYYMSRHTGRFTVMLDKNKTIRQARLVGTQDGITWAILQGGGYYKMMAKNKYCEFRPFKDSSLRYPGEIVTVKSSLLCDGRIWVVDTKGLYVYDPNTGKEKRILLSRRLNQIICLKSGHLAISSYGQLVRCNIHTLAIDSVSVPAVQDNLCDWFALAEDPISGNIWLSEQSSGQIVLLLPDNSVSLFLNVKNKINVLYIDRSRNLWVGTEGEGVYRIDVKPNRFHTFLPKAGRPGFMVKGLWRDTAGYIWMSAYGQGIYRYSPTSGQFVKLPTPGARQDSYFGTIMTDSAGYVITSMGNEVHWRDTAGRIVMRLQVPRNIAYSIDVPDVYTVAEWKKGHYLLGTNVGLYSVTHPGLPNGGRIRFLNDSFTSGWVYGIVRHWGSDFYLARRNGYCRVRMIDDSTAKGIEKGLIGLPVRHFYQSARWPVQWIATEQGLVVRDTLTGKMDVFDETSGIANSYIYAILPEDDSTLWVSTNNGLSRVMISGYRPGGRVQATFRNYTAYDGLQSNEFNTGAYHLGSDGTLYFGGIAGINWFRPADIVPNPYKAIPAITAIYVNDTLVTGDTTMFMSRLELPWQRNTLSFTLRALEYTQPLQNLFAYRLTGVDRDWVYTANDKVRYSNLDPGTYEFQLKVRNNETVWNDKPLVLTVVIHPPFWQTWWFRLLMAVTGGTAVVVVARLYARGKVRARTRELEQQHALHMERMRISKDVHDDIGSGLSRISLLSAVARRKLHQNEAPESDINHISALSRELVDNMRDLIWLLNPENTTLDSLAARIREYSADFLDAAGIAVHFQFPAQVPAVLVPRDVQRNVLLTVKEAVNNVVKHSGATKVTIELQYDGSTITIAVADNGRGLPHDDGEQKGNGLRNMRYRIGSVGGTWLVTSAPGEGTKIAIAIPLQQPMASGV